MKYKFVEGDVTSAGFKRIVALRSIARHNVRTGQLGGYIRCGENLSQSGDCWVGYFAHVGGNALVADDAAVFGYAIVRDNARVLEDARVTDRALISGHAMVRGTAKIKDDAYVGELSSVDGCAVVSGSARIRGSTRVAGNSVVHNTTVSGNCSISGDALITSSSSMFCANNVGRENGTLTMYRCKDDLIRVTRGCFIGTTEEFLNKSREVHNEKIRKEYAMLIKVGISRIND